MTAEAQDNWKITPQVRSEAERVGAILRDRNERLKTSTAMCPTHKGIRGSFSHIAGSYSKLRPIYTCPEGNHKFYLQD